MGGISALFCYTFVSVDSKGLRIAVSATKIGEKGACSSGRLTRADKPQGSADSALGYRLRGRLGRFAWLKPKVRLPLLRGQAEGGPYKKRPDASGATKNQLHYFLVVEYTPELTKSQEK